MIERLVVGGMSANCYLYADDDTAQAAVIDPGDDADYIADHLLRKHWEPRLIVATHGHFDHLMAVTQLQLTYHIPFYIHGADRFLLPRAAASARHYLGVNFDMPPPTVSGELSDKDRIAVGKRSLQVISVPGHTPGSIVLYDRYSAVCFVGDTVFADGAVGRTDFVYSDSGTLQTSLKRILRLPSVTVLYPGHGQPVSVATARSEHPGVV